MTKMVPSFEHTLKKRIEALEGELALACAENARLKSENTSLSLALSKQSHKTALSSKKLTVESPSNTPSYLRPTVASTNRAVKPAVVEDSKAFVEDRSPMYIDGKLVVINKPRPHYELSTRAKGSYDGIWGGVSTFNHEEKTRWVTYSRPVSPTPKLIRMRYECESCNKLEAAWEDQSAHSLAARSRLDDAEHMFQLSAAACVNIPYRKQHQLLHSAFTLCQDIIWHHLRKHCPNRQIAYCFEGPREVAFCRGELLGLIAGVNWGVSHDMTFILTHAMVGVTDLRNTLAHQNRVSLAMVDVLITRAQKLAVVCMDEKRAMKLRRLRDELRMHAEKAVADINEKYHGTWGPFQPKGRQWPLHHQRTFHDLIEAHESKQRWRYDPAPEVVKMAAREWHAENHDRVLGSLNHEYIAALEKASACLTETGPMTPPPAEMTAGEQAAMWEKCEKEWREESAVREAAVKAACVSDEGEGDVLGHSAKTAW